tara:strand:- start:451 stop:852 length:402 start_codon:yes stop_codon:yes gene_type:complete
MVIRRTEDMIAKMAPERLEGLFAFATSDDDALVRQAVATIREAEGLSLILPLDVAQRAGLDVSQPMACLTLNVVSALDGVGLTADVATALACENIACNMVAGHHHDHAFVPANDADRALSVLHMRAAAEVPDV